MKRKGRIWIFVALLLVVALTVTAVLGFTTRYGDVTTTVAKPLKDATWGVDAAGRVTLELMPVVGAEPTESQMESIRKTIGQRLSLAGAQNVIVTADEDAQRWYASFSYSEQMEINGLGKTIEKLMTANRVEVRIGTLRDADNHPTGDTALDESLILSSDLIRGASMTYGIIDYFSSDNEYIINLTLDDITKQNYINAVQNVAFDAASGGMMSIWIDGVFFSEMDASRMIFSSEALLANNFDRGTAQKLLETINYGQMPFALQLNGYKADAPLKAPTAAVFYMALASLAVLAIVLLAVYRLPGAVSAVALVAHCALTLVLITGYFNVFTGHALSRAGIAALFIVMGLSTWGSVLVAARLREEIRAGKKFSLALSSAFSWRNIAPAVELNVLLVLVAIITAGAFAHSKTFFATLLYPVLFAFPPMAATPLYSFGYVLFWGSLFNLFTSLFLPWAFLKLFSRAGWFTSPLWYGGVKENDEPREVKPSKIMRFRKALLAIPALLLAATIAVGCIFGVPLDGSLVPGRITATYSYVGDIDINAVKDSYWLRGAINVASTDKEYYLSVVSQPADLGFAEQRIVITIKDMDNATSAVTAAILKALQDRFPTMFVREVSASITTTSQAIFNIVRLGVVLLFGLLIIWLYAAIRLKRFGTSKALLPLAAMQVLNTAAVLLLYFALRLPLGATAVPVLLIMWCLPLYYLMQVYERVTFNRSLYGKKMSLKEIGALSLAQCRGRMRVATVVAMLPMIGLWVLAWGFAVTNVLILALPMLGVLLLNHLNVLLFAAPWWIARLGKKPKKKIAPKKKTGKKAAKGKNAKTSKAGKGDKGGKKEPDDEEEEDTAEDEDDDDEDEDEDEDENVSDDEASEEEEDADEADKN